MTFFERALGEHPERAKSRQEKQRQWSDLLDRLKKANRSDGEMISKEEIQIIESEMESLRKELTD